LASSTALADGDDPPEIDPKAVDRAVGRGVKFITGNMLANGSFEGKYARSYPMGYNALCLLTLLKGGVDKKHPAVKNALGFLRGQGLQKTYGVGLLLMALEAYYTPPKKKKQEQDSGSGVRTTVLEPAEMPEPSSKGKKWAQLLANWLVEAQVHSSWTYTKSAAATQQGGIPRRDNSNAQYALLGLLAARRLGCKVPKKVFERSLEYFLKMQEEDGPEVDPFPVPASIDDVFRREPENLTGAKEKKEQDGGGTVVPEGDDGARPGGKDEKKAVKFKARGWDYYTSKVMPNESPMAYASMTAVGVACVIISKSELVDTSGFKKVRDRTNSAIKDGCAWLSLYYDPAVNVRVTAGGPKKDRDAWPNQHYYFLYAIERCGVFSGCERFGKKYWYLEGAKYILGKQRSDGSWREADANPAPGGAAAQPQLDLCPTCFAILFLKRATVPLNKRPIYTGDDLFKPKKQPPPTPPPAPEEPGG
jgi:hypothetical protein